MLLEYYAESKKFHNWALQRPHILWQTESEVYHKILIHIWNDNAVRKLAGCEGWFRRNELIVLTNTGWLQQKYAKKVLMHEKQWRNVGKGSVSTGLETVTG